MELRSNACFATSLCFVLCHQLLLEACVTIPALPCLILVLMGLTLLIRLHLFVAYQDITNVARTSCLKLESQHRKAYLKRRL